MERSILLLLIIGITFSEALLVPQKLDYDAQIPAYIECVSSTECLKSECCAVNQGRFSIPTCRPRPDIGDPCRPGNEPYSANVTYPDGITVHLKDVYLMLCPCHELLTCSAGICIDPSEDPGFNYMSDLLD